MIEMLVLHGIVSWHLRRKYLTDKIQNNGLTPDKVLKVLMYGSLATSFGYIQQVEE